MASLDVKTAFLNAELGEGARPVEGPTKERMVLTLFPKILVRLGLVKEGELWAVWIRRFMAFANRQGSHRDFEENLWLLV